MSHKITAALATIYRTHPTAATPRPYSNFNQPGAVKRSERATHAAFPIHPPIRSAVVLGSLMSALSIVVGSIVGQRLERVNACVRKPNGKCGGCGHIFILAHLPMPVETAAQLMKRPLAHNAGRQSGSSALPAERTDHVGTSPYPQAGHASRRSHTILATLSRDMLKCFAA